MFFSGVEIPFSFSRQYHETFPQELMNPIQVHDEIQEHSDPLAICFLRALLILVQEKRKHTGHTGWAGANRRAGFTISFKRDPEEKRQTTAPTENRHRVLINFESKLSIIITCLGLSLLSKYIHEKLTKKNKMPQTGSNSPQVPQRPEKPASGPGTVRQKP